MLLSRAEQSVKSWVRNRAGRIKQSCLTVDSIGKERAAGAKVDVGPAGGEGYAVTGECILGPLVDDSGVDDAVCTLLCFSCVNSSSLCVLASGCCFDLPLALVGAAEAEKTKRPRTVALMAEPKTLIARDCSGRE